jgi:hypothetical protein
MYEIAVENAEMSVEDRPEERRTLELRGLLALEYAAQHEPVEMIRELRPLLRLWNYPAFFPYTSWTVFDPPDASRNRLVRQVQWDRPHDMLRFSDPLEGVRQGFHAPPSLRVNDAYIADGTLQQYLDELSRLPIAVVGIAAPLVLDGEVAGLQVYEHFFGTQVQWSGDGPSTWSAFTAAVARLQSFLADQFIEGR